MKKIKTPINYRSILSIYETQEAIELIKNDFQKRLSNALNLKRVSSPIFVDAASGLNDNLNGTERPVAFDIKGTNTCAEVVHSLAKWKRFALARYGFKADEGLYTDMNAIRRDEDMDNIHSIYVDQWDWEKVIVKENRTADYLKNTVSSIVAAICDTNDTVAAKYNTGVKLKRDVFFITSQELEDLYPSLPAKEREYEIVKKHSTVFIMQIGGKLKSGQKHDGRAPDYDDWTLNGDIMFYAETLDIALELSSMGIRVDEEAMIRQLAAASALERTTLPFHKALLEGRLPLTMGGGIGQSRLCMLMLKKAHIGEVHSSIWDKATLEECEYLGIELL